MGIDNKVKVQGLGRTEKEPLNCIDPDTFYVDWEINSAWSLQFTAHDDGSFAYSMLDAQASLFYDGQQYIIKQAEPDANSGVDTIDVVATHVYFEIARIRKYKTYVDPSDAGKDTDVKVNGSEQDSSDNSGDDSGGDDSGNDDDDTSTDDPNAQKTVTTTVNGNTTTKTTVTKTDETKDNDNNQTEYHIEDVLKYWIDGNQLGFSYQVIGNFPTAKMEQLSDGSGTDMLSKIVEAWPNAVIYPDNKNIRVYTQDAFYKNHETRLDYLHNTTEFKWTYDSTSLTNEILCVGGKYSLETDVDTTTVTQDSGDPSHGSGGPGADRVANDAKQYLGVPYVWGGAGGARGGNPRSGMDCSSFVSQVYKDMGIYVPAQTVAMEPYFHEIPASQIQTGDVGFYGPHGGTYHICLILNSTTDIYEPAPGQSCMTQAISAFPPTWYARNDQMAAIIGGQATSGSDNTETSESSSSKSAEYYYFAPFMYRDEKSIKEYGEYPAEPFEDDSFSDKNAMTEAAKAKIQPQPALSLEATLNISLKPIAGDMIHIMAGVKAIKTNLALVGYNYYPYSKTNFTSVTLNSTTQSILDYQNAIHVELMDALNRESKNVPNISLDGGNKNLYTWLIGYVKGYKGA